GQERFTDAHGDGIRLTRRFPVAIQPLAAEWPVSIYDEHEFIRIEVALRNTGEEPITVRRIFPFVTGAWWANDALKLHSRTSDFSVYKNGWQSWSYAGGMPVGTADLRPHQQTLVAWHSPGGADPRQPVTGKVDVVSESVAMVGHADQREAFVAGFLSADTWLGQIYTMREEGACAAVVLTDEAVLQPGERLVTPPLALALGAQQTLLSTYAAAVAREGHARGGGALTPTGWSSWYYYYSRVTEEDILENLTALRGLRGGLPIRLVQIEDGYETAVGDWLTANEKFPHGMKSLAERIQSAGYRPALWLAPFTVAANSLLAEEHPEWLVHDRDGRPADGGKNWDTQLYGLDTSHPGARAWLRQVITTLVRDWGFDYLKLDFLASGALLGERYDPSITRAGALREGLALIREAAGERTFLLGCGCPML
ncbi:MAG: glycoside hydrolase family 36 protein, partial [Ktedonobacterales bacterium]